MTTLKHIMNNIALGETIYVLHLKEYQIQPLFHSKTDMEPKRGNLLTDIP